MFVVLAVVILGSALMCVFTKRIMRAATFLLFVLFGVAGMFFLLDYTYLGAAQISVYAGGITMLYVFAIQLVSKRTLQGLLEHVKGSKVLGRALVCLVGFVTLAVIVLKNHFIDMAATVADREVPMDQVGSALVGADKYGYVLPFEFISVFLLACIVVAQFEACISRCPVVYLLSVRTKVIPYIILWLQNLVFRIRFII